jgi:competence protein ComEC
MSKRKLNYLLLLCLFITAILLWLVIDFRSSKKLKVIFFDVGQGDAILITEGSQQLLIDGGKDGKLLLEKMGKYVPFWDRRIETVVETHPDQDHIGGLIEIFRTYEVGSVVKTKVLSDSQTFKKLEEEIAKQQPNIIEAKNGIKLQFPNGEFADVLYPFDTIEGLQKETNASSVVVKLETANDKMLFTGDLPLQQEDELIKNNLDLAVDVLKVGHHGSKYSSGNELLKAVKAKYAVISVGRQNSYGHPNQETIQRLLQNKLEILRTDQLGDIVFDCSLQEKCSLAPL